MTDTTAPAEKKITTADAFAVWQSIDNRLRLLCEHFGIGAKPAGAQPASGTIASDADLNGKYGDPAVKAKDPRDWTGESQLGKPFSECPPEYLEMVADRLDYFTTQNEEAIADPDTPDDERAKLKKNNLYNRKDASRARGWAARIRGGWKPPQTDNYSPDATAPLADDDIPF